MPRPQPPKQQSAVLRYAHFPQRMRSTGAFKLKQLVLPNQQHCQLFTPMSVLTAR